jgi:hypothetical protein
MNKTWVKRMVFVFLLLLMMSGNSCYIVRYKKLQESYERCRKDYSKENSKLKIAQQKSRILSDSLLRIEKQLKEYRETYIRNQELCDSLTRLISGKLNDNWSKQEMTECNTAVKIKALSTKEREIYTYLNLARTRPSVFAEMTIKPHLSAWEYRNINDSTYIKADTFSMWAQSYYDNSLYLLMKNMEPAGLLTFDQKCWESAECHATTVGKAGKVTHDREPGCKSYFSGECCHYGSSDPLGIIVDLLIDRNVESLGHRSICLGKCYDELGVSMKPHKTYGNNTTLDFH